MAAYESAAALVKVSSRTVRTWVLDFETYEIISKSQRGKNSKVKYCPIVDDLDFREEFKNHVRQYSRQKGKKILKWRVFFMFEVFFIFEVLFIGETFLNYKKALYSNNIFWLMQPYLH